MSPVQRSHGLVSVVIPTRDRQRAVADAVRSVANQTYGDLEIIVVDDGSYPRLSLADLPADPRIRLYRTEGRGAAAARNRGMVAANGEFVAFLDDDDRWKPTKTQTQLDALIASGASWAACGYRLWDGEAIVAEMIPPPSHLVRDTMLVNCCIQTSTVLLRRTLADLVGPMREDVVRVEDWMWFLEASEIESPVVIDQPLVDRAVNQTAPTIQREAHARFFDDLSPRISGLPPDRARAVARSHRFNLAVYDAKAGRRGAAASQLLRQWVAYPRDPRPLVHVGRTVIGESNWRRLARVVQSISQSGPKPR